MRCVGPEMEDWLRCEMVERRRARVAGTAGSSPDADDGGKI
jgi:hypothetical protein